LAKDDVGGIRPIGVGEAWRRLCLKAIGRVTNRDVMEQCGVRQICAGQPSGCEAAAHWMRKLLPKEETEMILLVDASNAFNAANRGRLLRTVSARTPTLGMAARNIYLHGSDLILPDGDRLRSREGTTQGCPVAMQCFALSVLPLIEKSSTAGLQQEWYADDSCGVGTVVGACRWFKKLVSEGGNYGYNVNKKKTIAIVKRSAKAKYEEIFRKYLGEDAVTGDNKITLVELEEMEDDANDPMEVSEEAAKWGSRYLGAGMGGERFRRAYVGEKVNKWTQQLQRLVEVAEVDPQVAYSLLVHGIVPRWSFLMRSTPSDPEWFAPMEEVLTGPLSEALFGYKATGFLRERLALPGRHAGLAIPDPRRLAEEEYLASRKVTENFSAMIDADQVPEDWISRIRSAKTRKEIRETREKGYEEAKKRIKASLVGRARRAFEESDGRGKSGILTKVPTSLSGLEMPALWWQTCIQLRLGLPVKALPDKCPDCQRANDEDHALGDGKRGGCGGARTRRHNEIGEFLLSWAEDAGYLVPASREPSVGKIDVDDLDNRCDGIIRGLRTFQREAWVDILCCDTGAPSHRDKDLENVLSDAERDKNKKHYKRVSLKHNADFVPIVCSVYGTMANQCRQTITTITNMQLRKSAEKRGSDLSQVLHLNRARFQACVWKAVAMNLVGRKGLKTGRRGDDENEESADIRYLAGNDVPWLIVAEDARGPRGGR